MKAYMIKEVSEKLRVPIGTLRQWEVDFKGIIEIPRDSKGARYYTDFEIEILNHIKTMRGKKLSKDVIKELLQKKNEVENENSLIIPTSSIPQMKQSEAIGTLKSIKKMLTGFEELKGELVKELREGLREEIIREVKEEIASSSDNQQKLIQESNLVTSEQLEGVSNALREVQNDYENEIKRRDEVLIENLRLLQEIKSEKKKGFLEKLFGK